MCDKDRYTVLNSEFHKSNVSITAINDERWKMELLRENLLIVV